MQTVSLKNRNNNIAFKGIKQDKILAETVLKSYKSVVPHTKSNTHIKARINRHYEDYQYKFLIKKLFDLEAILSQKVTECRAAIRQKKVFNSFDELTNTILQRMRETGVGNCGEKNYILQNFFLKKNINAHAVRLVSFNRETLKKAYGKDHTFIVFNLKPNARLDAPNTWGNKAIIADAYANIVMRAKEALSFYKEYFAINTKKEFQIFFNADKIKLPDNIV